MTVETKGASLAGAPSQEAASAFERAVISKVAKRLIWFLMGLYLVSIMDRGNASFAALSMNKEVGLTAQMFGTGIGLFFFAYAGFELPSTLILARFGARLTLTRISILWGLATMLMVLTRGPLSFYALRVLLGLAEAGLFPCVMLYLSHWFPSAYRARYNAWFNFAAGISYILISLISGGIMEMDGVLGLSGWKWLFLLEGLPSILLGVVGIFYLTDRPLQAKWLTEEERRWLQAKLDEESQSYGTVHERGLLKTLMNPLVLMFGLINFCHFFGLVTMQTWVPTMLKSYGFSYHMVGFLAALAPLGGIIGMIYLSRRSDRKQERVRHSMFTMLLASVGFVIAASVHTPAGTVIGFMMVQGGMLATQAIFWAIPQTYLNPKVAPGAVGLIATMGSIGGGICPMLVGYLKDKTHHFEAPMLMVAAVIALNIFLMYCVGRWLRNRNMTGPKAGEPA